MEDYAQCRDFLNLEYIREHLKHNKVISCTAKHQNGKWILMILVPQKYDERGDIESFLLLCRDVTGEKERVTHIDGDITYYRLHTASRYQRNRQGARHGSYLSCTATQQN